METKNRRDLMTDFEKLTPLQREYRPRTMRTYMQWLKKYAQWAGPDAPLSAFTPERLREYRNQMLLEGAYRPRSRANMYAALRSFGSWLVEEAVINANPADVLGKVKLDEPKRRVVAEDDSRALLAACERIYNPRRRALARAVLSILTYGGLRRSELLDLHVSDFVPDPLNQDKTNAKYKLLVRNGKGGKSREVPICDPAAEAIQDWLPLRVKTELPNLFVQNANGALSEAGLVSLIKRVCHEAGCTYANPHSHRHGYVSRLLLQKEDLKAVSELVGHTNTSTTLNIYYHTTDTRKREVADRAVLKPLPPTDEPAPLRIVDFGETA